MSNASVHQVESVPRALRALFEDGLAARLVALRRDLHQHPELSFQEARTADGLFRQLSELRPAQLERIGETGVVARIAGKDQGAPVVAIRGDIDALPIQEETGLPFASAHAGVMHACGHDVHATWTVGAAYLLTQNPAHGDVIIVLQPAEEIGKGALAILESGVIDDARMIFGGHVDRRYEVGKVVAQSGPLAAASDTFHITLKGIGGHGARPHESRDPIIGTAALVNALHHIVSRRLDPADAGVITVGQIQAGTAPNVVPDAARFSGTLRSLTPSTRQLLRDEVTARTYWVAQAYGLEATVELDEGTPPIMNDDEAARFAAEASRTVLGADAVSPLHTLNMASEDFAFYLERMPGCFLRIGAREAGGEFIPVHSPRFFADDGALFAGAAVLAESARVASRALAEKG